MAKKKKNIVLFYINVADVPTEESAATIKSIIDSFAFAKNTIVYGIPNTEGDNHIDIVDSETATDEEYTKALELIKELESTVEGVVKRKK